VKKSVYFLTAVAVFAFFLFSLKTHAVLDYSRNPSGDPVTSPITITVNADTFAELIGYTPVGWENYWKPYIVNIDFTQIYKANQQCVGSETLSGTFTVNVPDGFAAYWILPALGQAAEQCDDAANTSGGVEWEGDGISPIFTVVSAPSAEGGRSNFQLYAPEVEIIAPTEGYVFSKKVEISYTASDKNEQENRPEHGLLPDPVSVYYLPKGQPELIPIAENLSASSTIVWDTSNLADGEYKIIIHARGIDGDLGEKTIEKIIIDNTPPVFSVRSVPSFSRGENVSLAIESDEPLISSPKLRIVQSGHEGIDVAVKEGITGRNFAAIYKVIKGFDGPAKIFIEGKDLAGNTGNAIAGNDSFAIGIKPPPSPDIKMVPQEVDLNNPVVSVSGSGLNAVKATLKVNGRDEYAATNLKKGGFVFEKIKLDANFNKGRNILSVTVQDPAGISSQPSVIETVINKPPAITLTEPRGRLTKLNGLIKVKWSASDFNEDALKFSLELSDNGGRDWTFLAKDLKTNEFIWDSGLFPDGSNYILRATVFDGKAKTSVLSNRLGLDNNLPAIILEKSGDFFTRDIQPTIKGVVRSKTDLLVKLEVTFDGGEVWKEIPPEDGKWDSAFEKFGLNLPMLGSKPVRIILRGETKSGRFVSNAQRLKVFFDDKKPSFVSEDLPKDTSNKNILLINGIARDDFSGIKSVEYSVDDSRWFEARILSGIETTFAEFKIEHPEKLKDGEHEIKIRVMDRAGNVSEIKSQKLDIDATPPRIGSFILKTNGSILLPVEARSFEGPANAALQLIFSVAGNPEKVELFLNNDKIAAKQEGKLRFADLVMEKDKNVLTVLAQDAVGNIVEKEIAKYEINK